jgi:hypothetical protein
MKQVWFRGTKHEDKDQRRVQVLHYRTAFDELKDILNTHYKRKQSVRDYGEPGWELRQIAVNEYNQVIDDIIDLITFEKE